MAIDLTPPSKKLRSLALLREAPRLSRVDVTPFAVLYVLLAAWHLSAALAPTPSGPLDVSLAAASVETVEVPADEIVIDEPVAAGLGNATDLDADGAGVDYANEPSILDDAATALRVFTTAGVVLLHILAILFCHWSVEWRVFARFCKVGRIEDATVVKVVPNVNQGKTELCRIVRNPAAHDPLCRLSFEFNKTRFLYDDNKKCFRKIDFELTAPLSYYLAATGYQDARGTERAQQKYGPNELIIPLPEFWELFQEQALAPFFIFQVFCVGLWMLDEFWYYSLFTLFLLVTFESTVVKARLKNLADLRGMRMVPRQIMVYRNRKWQYVQSDELVPGDVCSLLRGEGNNAIAPCDILLLRGSAITDEAMLTGESVPQSKEPLCDRSDLEAPLDIQSADKAHIIFSGTKLLQHTNDRKGGSEDKESAVPRAPNGGCIGYVLRTGFQTGQGQLMRMILTSVDRVTANNWESFLFICFLLCFAIAAAGYVLKHGLEDESRSRYQLLLNCTLIITSVVPPELPMELSLAVNNSLIALMRKGIFCTEPFRIPLAGKLQICCFDKTGTLTSDTIVLKGIAVVEDSGSSSNGVDPSDPPCYLTAPADCSEDVIRVLAGCQSLVHLDSKVSGDPMELAAIKEIGWSVPRSDVAHNVVPPPTRAVATASKDGDAQQQQQAPQPPVPTPKATKSVHIVHRHRFSSALKRMSVVARFDAKGDPSHWVLTKGAPETIAQYLKAVPPGYNETYKWYSRQGGRVIALAYRRLDSGMSNMELKAIPREEIERDLVFVGFAVFQCPLKKDSARVIQMLNESSHRTVMITGDHMLTACHVARNLAILEKPELCLTAHGDQADGPLEWISTDELRALPYEGEAGANLWENNDLCMSGAAMARIPDKVLIPLLPHIRVFARVSPAQKEFILRELRSMGHSTMMCGDGTNDVGALRQAHVGVAILNSAVPPKKKPKKPKSFSELMAESKKAAEAAKAAKGKSPAAQREALRKATEEMMEGMDDGQVPVVRLGDASIASPFTAKMSSCMSVVHIVRQGRCTLVTTLEMFKILALNCLITAYSLSVLYLDGVKMGDMQVTITGMLIAMCFLFISQSKPIEQLSAERPPPNIFNFYMITTVLGQFAVHLSSLIYVIIMAKEYSDPDDKQTPDEEFKPNLLNTCVFLISSSTQVATFAINHRGRPFMQSLSENKPLRNSLMATGGFTLACAAELFPDWNEFLELVPLPTPEFRYTMVLILVLDYVLCDRIEALAMWLFLDRNPKRVS